LTSSASSIGRFEVIAVAGQPLSRNQPKGVAAFAESNPQPHLGRQLHRLFAEQRLRNVKSAPRLIHAPYKTFRRVFDRIFGFGDHARTAR
jgi:hypothetical protein